MYMSSLLLAPIILPSSLLDQESHLCFPSVKVNNSVKLVSDTSRQQVDPATLAQFLPVVIHNVDRVAILDVLKDNQIFLKQRTEVQSSLHLSVN